MSDDTKIDDSDLGILLDTSYPLLKQFREKCPGTYKHSQNVASIVEGVSISLNLDITFMKVLSLYHDIGKMFNPTFFTENQLDDENPHDTLDPKISFQIISRHISDTVLTLLKDDHFPRDLIKIASQHHGNRLMREFYSKSENQNEDDFRYKGERPSRIESAILMICDCVEATSRSRVQKFGPKFDPKIVIDDTINKLLDDDQLDDIRIGDLQKIKRSLAIELQGTYQKRVEYKEE